MEWTKQRKLAAKGKKLSLHACKSGPASTFIFNKKIQDALIRRGKKAGERGKSRAEKIFNIN